MKKCLFLSVFLVICFYAADWAFCAEEGLGSQKEAGLGAEETAGQTVSKSALAATRVDSKLNETVLHKSVLDYSLPADISAVAKKCAAGEIDECYFSFKTFENSPDKNTASAANLELAVMSLQRGLVKQAVKYIEQACALNPDDPFAELSRGWILLSAG